MLAANISLTTANTALFPTRAGTRSIVVTNPAASAGNLTVSVPDAVVAPFSPKTLAPGTTETINLTPGIGQPGCGTLTATAASTATITAHSIPL